MIYLDHAATSPMERSTIEAMWPYLTETFANASSQHEAGKLAAAGLVAARTIIADVLNVFPEEVLFTSGGTESDNLAVKGSALATPRGRHIVTSAIEHEAITKTCDYLHHHHGFEITTIGVDDEGLVDTTALSAALRTDTTLCTVQYANNEVGTVQPIQQIATISREKGVPFHTDAVQAAGSLPIDNATINADLLSISGHKFGGPKGIGVLMKKSHIFLEPLLHGGGQEFGVRSGTSNVAAAVGLAAALHSSEQTRVEQSTVLHSLRDQLIAGIQQARPDAILTGSRDKRLSHHASFLFPGVSGESLLLDLEAQGIACSSGSACAAGSQEPSAVLTAMGFSAELAQTAVRFTLGRENTADEMNQVIAFFQKRPFRP